jgi:hypothetical protein
MPIIETYESLPGRVKDLSKKYRKSELIDFLAELGVDAEPSVRAYDLMLMLVNDLLENGVPDEDDVSDDFIIFLIDAGFIDEEGELLDFQYDEGGVVDDKPVGVAEPVEEVKYPECFGFADKRAPECRRCKVFQLCAIERVKFRPPCFGRLFSQQADECTTCIEANSCRMVCGGVALEDILVEA